MENKARRYDITSDRELSTITLVIAQLWRSI